jgi:type 1 glutamine amidotransferase
VNRREFIALLGTAAITEVVSGGSSLRRILYFTRSAGYVHEVLPLSKMILPQLGSRSGDFEVVTTDVISEFSVDNQKRYAAIIFYTSGELPMSDAQKSALLDFVRSGGGFIGIHSASDTFYTWPEYLDLIGGYFDGHPWHQFVRIQVSDHCDPLVAFVDDSLNVFEEIYQIRDFDHLRSHVLLHLDQSSVDMQKAGVHRRQYGWPLAWTRLYGSGRVFYSALGHETSIWLDVRWQRILFNAILWCMRKAR